ncbi:MAG: KH domain-containing protein [Dehalococcoidia bacterium]
MKDLVEYIAKAIVDNPDEVKVTEAPGEDGVVFKLEVASEDRGRVIGREGRTAKAMRTLLRIVAIKQNTHASLEIV